jgi:alkylation response protein AidB-like acyl-CoA dehydrogenase
MSSRVTRLARKMPPALPRLLDPRTRRVRDFLAKEMAPHADDWWGRAEFPHEIIPRFADLGIAGLRYQECVDKPISSLLSGFIALEMARVDVSMATFYGVHAGLAMGSIARWDPGDQHTYHRTRADGAGGVRLSQW